MNSRCFKIEILVLIVLTISFAIGIAQDEDSGPAELIVRKETVKNFITDPVVVANISSSEDVSATLPSTFILTSSTTGQQIYWNPVLCRLVAIKNGSKTPGFTELSAEGPHPFGFSLGAIGKPKYFGFRYVEGAPEFLYTYGQLSIEEKFEISSDGRKLKQIFKISSAAIDGAYSLPEKWRETATANNGQWSNNVLRLSREEMDEGFTVTFHLDPKSLR